MKEYSNGDNEQPTTCPECGTRTEWYGGDERQFHTCKNGCPSFIVIFEEEE